MTALQTMASTYSDHRIMFIHQTCWDDMIKNGVCSRVAGVVDSEVLFYVGAEVSPMKQIVKIRVKETMKSYDTQ